MTSSREAARRSRNRFRSQQAALLTGYGEMWLRRDGKYVVFSVRHPFTQEWVELIREFHDDNFDHAISPLGVEQEMLKKAPLQ